MEGNEAFQGWYGLAKVLSRSSLWFPGEVRQGALHLSQGAQHLKAMGGLIDFLEKIYNGIEKGLRPAIFYDEQPRKREPLHGREEYVLLMIADPFLQF